MKAIIYLLLVGAGFCMHNESNLFEISYSTIDGAQQSMGDWAGKKIVFVILPIENSSESNQFLIQLDSISKAHLQDVKFIGICSYEDGYQDSLVTQFRSYYRSVLGDQVIVTSGMYTRKTSAGQHQLCKWLTSVSDNMHFDDDISSVKQKVFVNEAGEMVGILGQEIPLNGRHVNKLLQ